MSDEQRRVESYFEYMEKYAFGDLKLFHKLSSDAEDEENRPGGTTSSSTSGETTRYPSGSAGSEPFPDFIDERKPLEVVNRATIPFALMIFACMDALGYLTRSDDKAENDNAHVKTQLNITGFFGFVNPGPTEAEVDCLIAIYRHGLGHNYFPKLGHAISYRSENPKDKLFFLDAVCIRAVLNVNRLERCFTDGFKQIKTSKGLYSQIARRLEKLNKYYEQHDQDKIMTIIREQQIVRDSGTLEWIRPALPTYRHNWMYRLKAWFNKR